MEATECVRELWDMVVITGRTFNDRHTDGYLIIDIQTDIY